MKKLDCRGKKEPDQNAISQVWKDNIPKEIGRDITQEKICFCNKNADTDDVIPMKSGVPKLLSVACFTGIFTFTLNIDHKRHRDIHELQPLTSGRHLISFIRSNGNVVVLKPFLTTSFRGWQTSHPPSQNFYQSLTLKEEATNKRGKLNFSEIKVSTVASTNPAWTNINLTFSLWSSTPPCSGSMPPHFENHSRVSWESDFKMPPDNSLKASKQNPFPTLIQWSYSVFPLLRGRRHCFKTQTDQ